ncbi:unnamed protein product [Spirodela intermedia]|uniref:Uncharacterized protein n=1 Tax=Spirodela intermedia TaxID=51605 RepID=A0ABN7EDZ6_SPIIN|nr:unnamed protein product [Spirodela intermedia]
MGPSWNMLEGGALLREDEEDLEVNNTSGSSAGAGSGDFHQYRQMRRREQDRLARMDVDYQRRKELGRAHREEASEAPEEKAAEEEQKTTKDGDTGAASTETSSRRTMTGRMTAVTSATLLLTWIFSSH